MKRRGKGVALLLEFRAPLLILFKAPIERNGLEVPRNQLEYRHKVEGMVWNGLSPTCAAAREARSSGEGEVE